MQFSMFVRAATCWQSLTGSSAIVVLKVLLVFAIFVLEK